MFTIRKHISNVAKRTLSTEVNAFGNKPLNRIYQSEQSNLREEIESHNRNEAARHNAFPDLTSDGTTQIPNSDLMMYETLMHSGRVYSPEDLSFEAKRPLRQAMRQAAVIDKFEQHQIEPLDEYKSFNLLSDYITDLGRIRPREQTGLSAKNQRKLSRSVRRARALSLLPTTAKHPSYNLDRPSQTAATSWIPR